MSIKELLGLESFNLCDEDIIKKINQARIKEVDEVVFTSGGKTVKIKLNKINPIGLTQGYDDYYSK